MRYNRSKLDKQNYKREDCKIEDNLFTECKEVLWVTGGCIGRFMSIVVISGILLLISALLFKIYLELFYCEVEFTKGASYYIRPYEYEIEGNKIKFKSLIFDRVVEGYDFRLIEPIIKK